jgi:hypothetical protein
MPVSKPKVIAAGIVGAILLGIVGVIGFHMLSAPGTRVRQVRVDPALTNAGDARFGAPAPVPKRPESEWMPKFREVYALKGGEVLKRVPTPFIRERMDFYRGRMHEAQVQAIPRGPDFYVLSDSGNDFQMITAWFGQPDVSGMIGSVLGIDRSLLVGPERVLNATLSGDIVVSTSATPEQKRAAFIEMLSKGLGKKLRIEQQDLERDAIVISGVFAYRAPAATQESPAPPNFSNAVQQQWRGPSPGSDGAAKNRIVLYRGRRKGNGWTGNGPDQFIRQISQITRLPVIVEGDLGGRDQQFQMDQSAYLSWVRSGSVNGQLVDELLHTVEAQSDLHLRRERRVVKTWVLSDDAGSPTTP